MQKVLLLILDGWGQAENIEGNAIKAANLPNYTKLVENNSHTTLHASGEQVGLPAGIMGNSEVGHENIGAGRVNKQKLTMISDQTRTGEFFENKVLKQAFEHAEKHNSKVHFMGLMSEGDVHSHLGHLDGLIQFADKAGLSKSQVYLHAISDGRDDPPYVAAKLMAKYEDKINVASVCGRYWAMDRDNNWDRIDRYFEMVTASTDTKDMLKANSASAAIENFYKYAKDNQVVGDSDEFVEPTLIDETGLISAKDAVIFFNFRPDRAIEISTRFKEYQDKNSDFHYVCFAEYDSDLNLPIAFDEASLPEQNFENALGEYISKKGFNQFRVAETEKFRHVTMFFNQRNKNPYQGEDRLLVPSPKVDTYDLQPEMSVVEVTDGLIEAMKNAEKDYKLVVCNFANPDMVGHTGDFKATIQALEAVDRELARVLNTAREQGYAMLITADHGNADQMLDQDGSTRTAHSTSLVPLILYNAADFKLENTKPEISALANIAPTILDLMGLEKPAEMTAGSLVVKAKVEA
jgi:2,3-bisphosphoglycerate-independent phosphoglycerate mutase